MLNLVRNDINIAEVTSSYAGERGQPPFDPVMMTALLLYSYCCDIFAPYCQGLPRPYWRP